MGQCFVLSRDGRSRYTISIDFGEANRSARLLIANNRLAEIGVRLAELAIAETEADAREAALQVRVEAAFAAYAAAASALAPGASPPKIDAFDAALRALQQERARNEPLRSEIVQAKLTRTQLVRHIAYLAGLTLTVVKQVWRPVWETSQSGLQVGVVGWTIDVDNMPDLQLLGGVGFPSDGGIMTAISVQSPEQAFWNVAVAPGWQKYEPLYRWGVVSSVNYEANTLDVTLGESRSITQRLDINQSHELVGVPSEYPEGPGLNIYAFAVGDRVVVRFAGRDWGQPRVVGFLDNPVKGRIPFNFTNYVNSFSSATAAVSTEFASGFVSRLEPRIRVVAPDIWRLGYYAIGWSSAYADTGLERDAVWDTDSDVTNAGGTYIYVSMINDGFGEEYGDTDAYYMMGPTAGSATAFDWIPELSSESTLVYAFGGEVGSFPRSSASNGLRYTWVMTDWGYNPVGSVPHTYFTYDCPSGSAGACFALSEHVAGECDVIWERLANGALLSRQKVTVGRYADGLGWRVIQQSSRSVWGT